MAAFTSIKVVKDIQNGMSINVGFTKRGNKHLFSDSMGRSKVLHKSDLLEMPSILNESKHVKSSGLSKVRDDRITKFHYFKARLHGNIVYLNVAEETRVSKGREQKIRYVYSVTDKIK
nr:MAG TPA: hypothetical protein [Caudoviricetes sp.]